VPPWGEKIAPLSGDSKTCGRENRTRGDPQTPWRIKGSPKPPWGKPQTPHLNKTGKKPWKEKVLRKKEDPKIK